MISYEIVLLNRDCEVFIIPSGYKITLPKNIEVTITQALGDSYTVNYHGNLYRIDGKDADCLGKEIKGSLTLPMDAPLEDHIKATIKTCYDPEIPVNIYDLGLIYEIEIKPSPLKSPQDATSDETIAQPLNDVFIKMTLTAPGCGMGPVLTEEVKRKIEALPQIQQVEIELVFDPPWSREMMSDAAKLQLGLF